MRNYKLDDFGTSATEPAALQPALGLPPAEQDDDRLAIYENGYQSGWDDCAAAEAEAHRKVSADLAANIAEATLTQDQARSDVLNSLGPLFEEIAAQFLPALAAEAIAPAVIAELKEAASIASDAKVTLIASPTALPALEKLVDEQEDLEIALSVEPSYAEAQVSLKFGQEHRSIDLTEAANRMAAAIRAFVQNKDQSPTHGGDG